MKKLVILLAVVVLAAAIGLGVLVNRNNAVKNELAAANKLAAETQTKLDETAAQLAQTGEELNAAKVDLDAALAATEAQGSELQGQIEAAKAEYDKAKADLEAQNADLTTALKDANAKVLGLRVLLDNAKLGQESAAAKSAELLGLVDTATSEKGQLSVTLDQALLDKAALEEGKLALEAQVAELTDAKAALETQVAELTAQTEALGADIAEAMKATEVLEGEKAALEVQVVALTGEKDALVAAQAVPAEAPQTRHGLGLVTSIGSVADATAEKAGAAQVNTTVCTVVLNGEGIILSVIWDVQQSKVTFDTAGVVTVPAPETLLSKLEKGDAYGMKARSEIGKEWYEQIDALAQYAIGKPVDEVLALETFDRGDGSHNAVPAVEELTGSVTITVGDYLASLQKAAENAQ